MQFTQGAKVVTQEGTAAGRIDRVVIDPRTNALTHVVLRRGLLPTEYKVVPVNKITSEPEEQLKVNLTHAEFDELPELEEEQYVMAEKTDEDVTTAASIYLYPPYPGNVPGTLYNSPVIPETHLNIPDNTVALKEGAKVMARDGKEVGHVSKVLMKASSDQVTHFLITSGLVNKEKRLIPVDWVSELTDEAVQLAVNSNIVENLPTVESTSDQMVTER